MVPPIFIASTCATASSRLGAGSSATTFTRCAARVATSPPASTTARVAAVAAVKGVPTTSAVKLITPGVALKVAMMGGPASFPVNLMVLPDARAVLSSIVPSADALYAAASFVATFVLVSASVNPISAASTVYETAGPAVAGMSSSEILTVWPATNLSVSVNVVVAAAAAPAAVLTTVIAVAVPVVSTASVPATTSVNVIASLPATFSTAKLVDKVPVMAPLLNVPALPVANADAKSALLAPLAPAVKVKPSRMTV